LRTLIVFYFWLLTLAAINRNRAEHDPLQKMLQLQLGRAARWSVFAQIFLPVMGVAMLWIALHPLLVYTNVVNPLRSYLHLLEQSLLVGASLFFSLKFLLPIFLLLHVIASYVYLGKNLLWDFISLTAGNLLRPFQRWPLRFGKIDFRPIITLILILLLLHTLPNFILSVLNRRDLTLWPQ
jgi:uncharacterized protein YggT (Ycf19 family)